MVTILIITIIITIIIITKGRVQGLIDRAAIVCNEDNIRKSVYLFTLYMHIKVQMLRFTRRNNCNCGTRGLTV